ncbi:MAG: N-6 DNA methylase [Gammaproteobacteria bacterium]
MTKTNEADARVLIDGQLRSGGWQPAQITREGAATKEQSRALKRGRPDYVLYRKGSTRPLAVIEAKKRGKDLRAALAQGLNYAQKIGCPTVFASDGVLTLSAHSSNGKPLMVNNDEVRELPDEGFLLNFLSAHIWARGEVVKNSRELISIFRDASKTLRGEGLANIDAFAEFSQVLFFKILSEITDANDERAKDLPAHWSDIKNRTGGDLLDTYARSIGRLGKHYKGVFAPTVEIKNPATLEKIIARLDGYSLIDINADVKGDAYEYFLRQYNRQKNDLAQYFTPRHVVSAMVALCAPRLGEKIYDPFCGTGGILVAAFNRLKKTVAPGESEEEQIRRGNVLRNHSVYGADISRTASAAKMNMILAGDGHSNIERRDSLQNSEARGKYDVVITNIPFVPEYERDYIEHCLCAAAGRSGGRVCIIVPERVLDAPNYGDFRAKLVREWEIKRVISLPREIFRGFTSAKTSILYALWRGERQRQSVVSYIDVRNDGYTLDKKRNPLPGQNDLDDAVENRHLAIDGLRHLASAKNHHTLKPAMRQTLQTRCAAVPLGDIVKVAKRPIAITADMLCREPGMRSKDHRIYLREERLGFNVSVKNRHRILPGDLVFSRLHTQDGLFAFSDAEYHGTSTYLACIIDESRADRDFLFWALDKVVPTLSVVDTTGRENYKERDILALMVPLPPIAKQRKIIAAVKAAQEKVNAAAAALADAKEQFASQLFKAT